MSWAFHELIERLLLLGQPGLSLPPPPRVPPPTRLAPLVAAVQHEHAALNRAALAAGHRYRSAFWALYLRAALAVWLAVMPVALGWAHPEHPLHAHAPLWGAAELILILSVAWLHVRGVRQDWQGRWLHARAQAELCWYLPLAAALREPSVTPDPRGWYAELFGPAAQSDPELAARCRRLEDLAALPGAWQDAGFTREFSTWLQALLAGQCHYHRRQGLRQRALQRRVHGLCAGLFVLTALAAALHLVWHAEGLLIATTGFPALGAALHGALVQAESYQLGESAERLQGQLQGLIDELQSAAAAAPGALRGIGYAALALLLDEHQDWHGLIRPHQLPLG